MQEGGLHEVSSGFSSAVPQPLNPRDCLMPECPGFEDEILLPCNHSPSLEVLLSLSLQRETDLLVYGICGPA